jgi:DNA-3-methyladenine glycosylase II
VPDRRTLAALDDAAIIERLTQVRGVGRWTVEMLLMFQLGRPDVLPVDDFGVRAGFRAAYGLTRMPKPKVLALWGERWKPYRSAAAWYLWRALELARAGKLPAPAQRVVLPRLPRKRRKAKVRKRVPKRALAAKHATAKRGRTRARAAR